MDNETTKDLFYGGRVILCSQEEDPDIYRAKFVISDFSVNHNHVQLNRETAEKWIGSLVHKPLVGKIVSTGYGKKDFSGHNMRIVTKKDANGNSYKDTSFDTSAFGTFTDVGIEKIDDVECIVATCEIWRRFENACALILSRAENGTLSTSWEITPTKCHYIVSGGSKVKVIDEGVFTAHCLLGSRVSPAYDCSKLLEVAEVNPDFEEEFANAMNQDISAFAENTEEKEVAEMNKVKTEASENVNTTVESEPAVSVSENTETSESKKASKDNSDDKGTEKNPNEENKPAEDQKTDGNTDGQKDNTDDEKKKETSETVVSELTTNDIYSKINHKIHEQNNNVYIAFVFPESHEVWARTYDGKTNDLDMLRYTYSVNGDDVEVSEPEAVTLTVSVREVNTTIANLNKSVAEAAQKIQENEKEIAELKVYKDKFEQAERDRIAAEVAEKRDKLRDYAVSSGLIDEKELAEDGELASVIENVDEAKINQVIAERYMKQALNKTEKAKPATKHEVSERKERVEVAEVKRLPGFSDVDVKDIMKSYLGK